MRVYRPAAWVAWFGGFFTVVFLCVFLGHAVGLSVTHLSPRGPLGDLGLVAMAVSVYGTMTLMSLYVWAAGLTERIIVEGVSITFCGPIRRQTIDLRDVTRVRWRKNDSVTLETARCRQSVWFWASRLEDAADLIKLIRNNVPGGLQEGWHPFYQARMKGRLDRDQRFRLQHPHAKYPPEPIKPGRLLAISFSASMLVALAFWGVTLWELRNVENPPPSPLTGNWLLDCVLIGVLANVPPLSIVFIGLFRSRRKRLAAIVAEAETGQSHCPEQFTAA
jgi:hypothetical protein